MMKSIDAFPKHRVGVRNVLLWTVGVLVTFIAGAQSSTPSPTAAIDAITLERNGFGSTTTSVLVLRRDGSASLVETGNARQGIADKTSKGTVREEDFAALARLLRASGFFELADSYEDPQLRDGSWATTGVSIGAKEKRVFRREDAGPAALKAIEAAIEATQARIAFTPDHPLDMHER